MTHQLHPQRILTYVFFLLFSLEFRQCLGFTGTGLPVKTSNSASRRHQRSYVEMYVPRQHPSKQSPPNKKVVERQMIPNPASIGPSIRATSERKLNSKKGNKKTRTQRYNTELSNSVLAECNTLPSFPTAHGLLSPETVMRMEEMIEFEGHTSEAVDRFLKQYRRQGPMSCLSMLSDPDVLPHLTAAMRDVV